MSVLQQMEPSRVLYYFEEISKIPRGSGNIWKISNYLLEFAQKNQLFVIQDSIGNIIIKKDGTVGHEQCEPLILQGHMDIVAVKEPECPIDLEKDGLELVLEGDFLSAQGTSLGGDNGIAIAYSLAILESAEIEHPPLEVIFTVDEETGMEGANGLDTSVLRGTRLLNLDSEEEGVLLTGCAGGLRVKTVIPVEWTVWEGMACELVVSGLQGGHSGCEIHEERGNSNVIMGRVLWNLRKEIEFSIASLQGGLKDNAIPRETKAVIVLDPLVKENTSDVISKMNTVLQRELRFKDPGVVITINPYMGVDNREEKCAYKGLTDASVNRILGFLFMEPNGVQAMSREVEGLVETSLNMGIISLNESNFIADHSLRSSVATAKENLCQKVVAIAEMNGGTCNVFGDYPSWEYRPDSVLRQTMIDAYTELYGREPRLEAIHAGLECGILAGKIKDLDCVSIGPDMEDIHTTRERLSISSTKRTWEFILETLKRMN